MLLRNETPYQAVLIPTLAPSGGRAGAALRTASDTADTLAVVVCVALRYQMPLPPRARHRPYGSCRVDADVVTLTDEQPAVPLVDALSIGGNGSLSHAGQAHPNKPYCDVVVQGHVVAPNEQPTRAMLARVDVGGTSKSVLALGERRWDDGWLSRFAPRASEPELFVRQPLRPELAFGGPAHPANPVGIGMSRDTAGARGQQLPGLENPEALIRTPRDRPHPWLLGPIAPHWEPRLGHAGTWCNTKAENVVSSPTSGPAASVPKQGAAAAQSGSGTKGATFPSDFDPQFFQAAAEGLRIAFPSSGAKISLDGFHPAGAVTFALQLPWLCVRSTFAGDAATTSDRARLGRLRADGLWMDTDAWTLTVYMRHTEYLGAQDALSVHRETVLQEA